MAGFGLEVGYLVFGGLGNRVKKSFDGLRGEQRPLTAGESSSILINAKLRAKNLPLQ